MDCGTHRHKRHIAKRGVSTSDLAKEAAVACLKDAGVKAEDIDLIILASATPDNLFPATACVVQSAIGASKAAGFDMEIGCTGFIYALATGAQFVASGMYEKVLVIGAEALSRFVNWGDRSTCCLFGDGAGAVLLEVGTEGEGLIGFHLGVDGSSADLLTLPAGGAKLPASLETVEQGSHFIHMDGKAVFKFAVKIIDSAVTKVLEKVGMTADEIDVLIPHQANLRIIDSACNRFKISKEKVMVNIDKYGNTSSASVPIAMCEARKGRLKVATSLSGSVRGRPYGSAAIW